MKWAEQICALFVAVQLSRLMAAIQAFLLPSSFGNPNVLTCESKLVPDRRLHPGTTQQWPRLKRFVGIIWSAENIEIEVAASSLRSTQTRKQEASSSILLVQPKCCQWTESAKQSRKSLFQFDIDWLSFLAGKGGGSISHVCVYTDIQTHARTGIKGT